MISKNDQFLKTRLPVNKIFPGLIIGFVVMLFSGCYSFKDVSIPPEVKTVRVNLIQNKAPYINPQLSPLLTDRLRQKINNQTRLTLVTADDAHYDITCVIRNYQVTTAGISQQQAATNRLIVGVHIIFKNRLNDKASFEGDVSRNFDFNAGLSLQAAEAQLGETIVQNLTDEIFNRIFSNW
jgi:hypothetical protein